MHGSRGAGLRAARPPVGRFAPSPSGPLHFGSLVTAVGSYLHAKSAGGRWLLRIEDIDPPRERAGAADAIRRGLERCALHWDGPVLHQRTRLAAYREAVARLAALDLVFYCTCSRRRAGIGPYPGVCRERRTPASASCAIRVRVPAREVAIEDGLRGRCAQQLAREVGDFVIWRADGHPAYHLAVVVDDAWQGVTDVVRGADLLDSTPRQHWLQEVLGLTHPRWHHLPLALDVTERKLSKQTRAAPVDRAAPSAVVAAALAFLGHPPPVALGGAPPGELLDWALGAWRPARVPRADRQPSFALADSKAARSSS